MEKVKKAQKGIALRKGQYKRLGRIAESNPERADKVADRMKERATRFERGKRVAQSSGSKASSILSKAKDGKSFPDLNKDGKITKADILKGRGVIAKKGAKVKKAQAGLTASNKRVGPVDPKGAWTKVQEMNLPPRNVKTSVSLKKDKELGATKMMKSGGKMKKKK
jgi:hypothetical protein